MDLQEYRPEISRIQQVARNSSAACSRDHRQFCEADTRWTNWHFALESAEVVKFAKSFQSVNV